MISLGFSVIVGGVGGNNRSAVNLKQCSTRSLNDPKERGLLFVSSLIYYVCEVVITTSAIPSIRHYICTDYDKMSNVSFA